MEERVRFLRGISLFEGLEEADVTALAKLMVERCHRKGNVLFFEGDLGDSLYMVHSGTVKIYRVAEDGREKTLAFLSDGEFFGEMALLDEEPRSAIAETLGATILFALRRSDFLKLLTETPGMSLRIIKVLSKRLRQTNAQLMDAVFRDVRARVVGALLDLADRHGVKAGKGVRIELKLTHQELANLVGTARETVSRILAQFQDAGCLVVSHRRLVLIDMDGLKAFACAS